MKIFKCFFQVPSQLLQASPLVQQQSSYVSQYPQVGQTQAGQVCANSTPAQQGNIQSSMSGYNNQSSMSIMPSHYMTPNNYYYPNCYQVYCIDILILVVCAIFLKQKTPWKL